jgi:GH18 family chitinase
LAEVHIKKDFHVMKKTPILLFLLANLLAIQSLSAQWVVGFYTVGMGQPISEVPWNKITHLNLCCAAAGANGSLSENWLTPSSYSQLRSMAQAANVKIIVSIGDQGVPTNYFPSNTTPGMVSTFANSIAAYINANGFDGVDLDWESNVNASQYIDLMAKVRAAMPNKLVMMDVGNWGGLDSVAAASHRNVDQLNVMCYDMAAGNGFSWHNAAVLQAGDPGVMTCDWRMRAFTNAGVPASKLGVGIPAYGYVWNGTTQPRSSGGSMDGTQYWYSQILGNPTWWNGGLNKRWNSTNRADYLSVGSTNQFVTYNDTGSVHEIVSWGKSQGFGGYMVLFLYQEYMAGASGDARSPITTALRNELGAVTAPPSTLTPPSITSTGVAGGTFATAYSQTLTATGSSPIAWSVTSGALPLGLSLGSSTGVISGTPAAAGTSTFTVQAANAAGTNSKQFSITVTLVVTPPAITSASPLPAGTAGVAYSQALASSGSGPITYTVTSGSLPGGLSLSSSTGVLGGTPAATGTSSFTIQAANSAGSNSKQFSITVNMLVAAQQGSNISDLTWTSATTGWGSVQKNKSVAGNVLTLNGVTYANGIGTHANSQITYPISGACTTFQADIGVDDEVGANGSVVFQVVGDGVTLYQSGVLTGPGAAQSISVSLAGRSQLSLVVNDAGDDMNFDHADWANARLTCGSTLPSGSSNFNLSDLNWTSATIGWGTVQKNASVASNVLTLNGATYANGIGTHANSQITYRLGNSCSTFQADVGIDDEVGGNGSVTFQVLADGVSLFQSGVMTGGSPTQSINVSVAGRRQIVLMANDGGDDINFDHADWANARLTCSSKPK